jgi:hypothetical protein
MRRADMPMYDRSKKLNLGGASNKIEGATPFVFVTAFS